MGPVHDPVPMVGYPGLQARGSQQSQRWRGRAFLGFTQERVSIDSWADFKGDAQPGWRWPRHRIGYPLRTYLAEMEL